MSPSVIANIKSRVRPLVKDTFLWDLRQRGRDRRDFGLWDEAGRPVPPPHIVKQRIVASHASLFGTETLVETGTLHGQMVYAMKERFRKIISIELSEHYYAKAKQRFQAYPHVEIVHGDSGELLPKLMDRLSGRCLFWLDGHYSGEATAKGAVETPIVSELRTILGREGREHVILIDDARLFNGTHDYPTVPELQNLAARYWPECSFSVRHDVIRFHPKRNVQSEI